MSRFGFLALVALAASLAFSQPTLARPAAVGPSFDCRKATAPLDRLICADPDLARADRDMALAYADVLKFQPGRRLGLIAEQRAWLAGRLARAADKVGYDSCFFERLSAPTETDRACVKAVYEARTAQLLRQIGVDPQAVMHARPDYAKVMTAGQTLTLIDAEVRCRADRLEVLFGSERDDLVWIRGRGYREAGWVDCPIGGGHVVRFKMGDESPPQPYGMCGAAPGQIIAAWVDRRQVVSAREVGGSCFGWTVQSLTVTAQTVETCKAVDDRLESRQGGAPRRGPCATTPNAGEIDEAAFVDQPPDLLTAPPSAELGSFCARLIDPKDRSQVVVPGDIQQPAWKPAGPGRAKADFSNTGFNATSLAASDRPRSAVFDLFNEGGARRVYQVEGKDHWFDGSAFAVERPGVTTTPFDAHDWERSVRSGIYPFVYDHATAFFLGGRTYVLLDPALATADPRVVRLTASGEVVEVCRLARSQERF